MNNFKIFFMIFFFRIKKKFFSSVSIIGHKTSISITFVYFRTVIREA